MDGRLAFEEQVIRSDLLKEIIGIADDIDMAIDHAQDEKGWREGVTHILEKFRTVIEGMGAKMIECKEGDEFDANRHEAVGVAHGGKDNTIATVLQNGYILGDVVVRPARVMVNKTNINQKSK